MKHALSTASSFLILAADDTSDEIQPLTQKILATKLWNEGLKATNIAVPLQYNVEDSVTAQSSSGESGGAPFASMPNARSAPTSRAEGVWGGKPWKTNVMELEGEVLCSEYWTGAQEALFKVLF